MTTLNGSISIFCGATVWSRQWPGRKLGKSARMGDAQSCLACDSKRSDTTREVRKAVPTHRYLCLLLSRCKVAGAAKTHLQIWEGAGLRMRAGGFAAIVASASIVWPKSKIIRMLLENGAQLSTVE